VSSTVTQRLIARDLKSVRELRRGTVMTDIRALDFDQGGLTSTVFVVDVNIGAGNILRDVIVKSATGRGAREFAQPGKAVEVQRNAGGRWICIGASDRIKLTACVQELDESDDSASAVADEGFTYGRRVFTYYADNNAWGAAGFGNAVVLDAQGNEVLS